MEIKIRNWIDGEDCLILLINKSSVITYTNRQEAHPYQDTFPIKLYCIMFNNDNAIL